jgi:hypothetical protein
VHYRNGDFYCGGFYTHTNGDKTTFVLAPKLAANNGLPCVQKRSLYTDLLPQITLYSLDIIQMPVTVISNPLLHQVQGHFCDTDCDDAPLNDNINNPNCGNQ